MWGQVRLESGLLTTQSKAVVRASAPNVPSNRALMQSKHLGGRRLEHWLLTAGSHRTCASGPVKRAGLDLLVKSTRAPWGGGEDAWGNSANRIH